jgi:predicted regulator of Ras-like GTPase activity (Roadblock/LC7/MglB family)
MNNDTYTFALRNALTEIRNVCPDVQTSFLFDKKATVVAGDADTPAEAINKVVSSLEGILEKADTIGGLNSLIIEGSKSNVHISYINDMYLTIVASKKADMEYLQTVARVLIPTVIKLLDSLDPTSLRQFPPSRPSLEPVEEEAQLEQDEASVKPKSAKELREELFNEGTSEAEDVTEADEGVIEYPEKELPSKQLIVESFGGLLVRNDTIQISRDIIDQWEETLDGKEIDLVEIESFNGQTSQCKVKKLDDSKLENKAIIRIPEKLCQTLEIRKGELVRVKPVIT